MLAEHLRDAGYYTAGFITAHYARGRFGFDQGFDIYEELAGNAGTTTDAEEINALVMNWLDTQWTPVVSGTQPLFLYLYYYDPHSWYNPPAPYDTLYDPTYTGTLTADIYRDGQDIVSGAIVPTPRDIEHILALYDGEITYWDASFADMMSYLEDLSLLDNAIIVVTSDHGEMFGEHGHWAHGSSLYEESLRVPLLLRYTGVVSPGVVITTPVQTMDIMPTILDLLNLPITPDLESTSLLPLVQGAPISETRDVFSELYANRDSWIASDFQLRAVRQGDWKYIHHIGLTNADELYMMQPQSLYETDNLLFTEPEEADSLWQLLLETYHLPTPQIYLPSVRR
jgi:arylsulfatase A-like enzyme